MNRIYIPSYTIFIFAPLIWVYIKKNKKIEDEGIREIWINIFLIYVLGILSITIFPINITFKKIPSNVNVIPFLHFAKKLYLCYLSNGLFKAIIYLVSNIGGNFLLLLPLGYILPKLYKRCRSLKSIFCISLTFSLSIELFQYFSMYFGNRRITDIDDLILNTLGAVVGYMLFKKYGQAID